MSARHLRAFLGGHAGPPLQKIFMKLKKFLIIFFLPFFLFSCHFTSSDDQTQDYLKQYSDQKQALEVDYTSPTGEVAVNVNKVVVHFTQPMVALSTVGQTTTSDLVTVTPRVDGFFKWVNTRTLIFQTKGNLPYATDFKVKVLAGKQSLLGFAMLKDFEFSFNTPEPRVLSVNPQTASVDVKRSPEITLNFNQSLSLVGLKSFLSFSSEPDNKAIDFDLICLPIDPKKVLDVCATFRARVKEVLPKSTPFKMTVLKGLAGLEGNRVTLADSVYQYQTHGDFAVTGVTCGNQYSPCGSGASLYIKSTNMIARPDFYKFVEFSPPLEEKDPPLPYQSYYEKSLVLNVELKPFQPYQITLKPGLKDVFDQELTEPTSYYFHTLHERAQFHFPYVHEQVLMFDPDLDFGFAGTNLQTVTARHRMQWTNTDIINFLDNPDPYIWFGSTEDGLWGSFQTLTGKKVDEREFFSFPASSILGEKKSGIIVSQYSSPEVTFIEKQSHAPIPQRNWILRQITNLAIHTKFAHNHGLVWVTRLDNGENIPSVKITFYNKAGLVLFQGTTNAEGILKTPSNIEMVKKSVANADPDAEKYGLDKFTIFAEKEGDRSFITSTWDEGLDTGYFYDDLIYSLVEGGSGEYEDEVEVQTAKSKIDSGPVKNIRVHMLTDRGLYKPGEMVNIKGYLREVAEPVLKPFQETVDVVISNSQGDEVLRAPITPNARGNFVQTYSIPEYSPLGSYSVSIQSIDEARRFEEFYLSFDVEHFRTPEFKVEATHPDKNYFKGDSVPVAVSANYLFGAPMKNIAATYSINKNLSYFGPNNDQGWQFGRLYEHRDDAREALQDRYLEEEEKLDEEGKVSVAVETESDLPDVMSYQFETGVSDLSGQSQWTSDSFIVHPADYYIGAKTDQFFFETGKPVSISFAALNPKGDGLFDKSVTVDLMRVTWVSLKSQTLAGEFETETQRKEERVDGCVKVSAEKMNRCDFTVNESGYYFFKLSATDAKKRLVVTEVPFYVSGKGYSYWPSEDGNGIELVLDKKDAYVTGETAKVLIKSPFQKAHAMISIEREGILSFEDRLLEGSSPVIEIPITKEYAPNIFVRVVLVKGALDYDPSQTQDPKNLTESLVKAGSVEIIVKPLNKDLKVALKTDREIYKPGDTVNLDLAVSGMTEAAGSEITVMAVDEGVLLAGGYVLRNPLDTFYASYTNQVAMSDTRTRYVRKQGSENKLADSSSGGGMESFRKKMIPLAYFNGNLETDAQGKAHVSFTLPDQLTSFKIMAVANASIDQFGLGESAIKTQKEIMIRPALPRFIRLGDRFESGAVLHNNTDKKMDMDVTVEADNLDIESGEQQKISVPAHGTVLLTAKFATPLKALKPKFDELIHGGKTGESIKANIRFVAKSQAYEDRVAITVPIRFEPAEETTATSGASSGEVSEFFEKSDLVDSNLGGLDIELSSGVATRLADKIRRLRVYPYDCFEQRMSKIYPLVLFPNTDAYFVGPDKDPTHRRQVIEQTLQKLKYEQNYSGEFSYWPGSGGDSQLTLMAGEFLLLAQKAGYDVETVLSRITERLFAYLKQTDYNFNRYSDDYKRELKVHALYVLYLAGTPQSSYYEGMVAVWDLLGGRNQLRLVEMLHADNAQHPLVLKFLDGLKNQIRLKGELAYVDAHSTDYDLAYSDKVATAVTLATLIKIKPDHPMVFPLLLGLLDQKTKGLYESSLDNLETIKTVRTYTQIFPDAAQDVFARINMNEKDLASFQLGLSKPEDHLSLPLSKLPEKMQLKLIKDKGPILFYDIKYKAFLKDYRSYGLEQGISLSREYTDLDGKTVDTADLKQGEMYKVILNLFFADNSDYVVLEEPIAAGLEPVNFNLRTERQSLEYNSGTQSTSSLKLDGYLSHREFRDDRVVLFVDHVPRGFYEFTYFVKVTNRGDYVVPPAKAQEMYNPEIFGTTGKQDVMVR